MPPPPFFLLFFFKKNSLLLPPPRFETDTLDMLLEVLVNKPKSFLLFLLCILLLFLAYRKHTTNPSWENGQVTGPVDGGSAETMRAPPSSYCGAQPTSEEENEQVGGG